MEDPVKMSDLHYSILKQSARAIVFMHPFDVAGDCAGSKEPTWEMTDADTLLLVFLRSAQ